MRELSNGQNPHTVQREWTRSSWLSVTCLVSKSVSHRHSYGGPKGHTIVIWDRGKWTRSMGLTTLCIVPGVGEYKTFRSCSNSGCRPCNLYRDSATPGRPETKPSSLLQLFRRSHWGSRREGIDPRGSFHIESWSLRVVIPHGKQSCLSYPAVQTLVSCSLSNATEWWTQRPSW